MPKLMFSLFTLVFTLPAFGLAWTFIANGTQNAITAHADPVDLLSGCRDIPEAVLLAEELDRRSTQMSRYADSIAQEKAELQEAEATLRARLAELKVVKNGLKTNKSNKSEAVQDDIARLVALYNQMKPAEAGAILTNLPADFAAEILLRVNPEAGARIIASVEPRQAAVLTAQIGSRSLRNK